MRSRLIYTLFITVFLGVSALAQTEIRNVEYSEELRFRPESDTSRRIRFQYSLQDGRMTGVFNAYYFSGKLKATGMLENGLRKGEWRVYYEDGSLAIKRFYHNPTSYEALYPKLPPKGPANLFGQNTVAPLKRDSSGFIPFNPIKEMDVFWEKRVYRWVPSSAQNRVLFDHNLLWETLWGPIQNNQLPVYTAEDAKFRTRLTFDSIKALEVSQLKLLGLEIKEIYFFNKQNQTMNVVILGIRPVFTHPMKQDTVRLFWLYYPQVRELLASVKISGKQLPAEIENLDDIFYFRHFSSEIYQESNVYNTGSPNFFHEESILSAQESEKIELSILDTDLEFWVYFNSKAFKIKN